MGRGHGFTPKRTREAEDRIREAVLAAYELPVAWDRPVGVDVRFFCATRRRTDGDNLLKLVTDAIQSGRSGKPGVILDDAQIEEWRARLFRRIDGEQPRTEIRVYSLDVDPG